MGEAALVSGAIRPGGEAPPAAAAAGAAPSPVVRVAGFVKRYGRQVAARGIDLEVRPGEIYGLIGPDGAGKSSLMKAVAGVLAFEAGEVEVLGVRLDSERAAERIKGRIGFMPQGLGLNLYPELSVEEHVDFFARLRLVPAEAQAARKRRLLGMTRLDRFRDRPMRHLSGGMKQKLGLVCTLIHEPDLVILDEPTTGVDPVSRRDFWAILAELLEARGVTALVSTAYMDEAARFHRMSLLFGGRVLAQGEPEAIRALAGGSLAEAPTEPRAGAAPAAAAQAAEAAPAEAPAREPPAAEPALEDVFVALLRREGLAGGEAGGTGRGGEAAESWGAAGVRVAAARGAAAAGGAAIEAQELVRDFDGFRAVDRVSFRIREGEIFGLVGANGAGKTTVIKMLTGILPPTAGTGRVAGADMRRAGRAIKERIGYMSQAFSLYRDLTVAENIRLYAGIYGLDRAETRRRTGWIVGMAGLAGHEGQRAGRLPMGVRQRLALGCALVHRPQVLFLDEPTSGVDPIGRRRFWSLLFRLSREAGVAVLVTTHDMGEAEHCDRLALMYAGRIVADASPAEMKRQLAAEAGRLLEVRADRPLEALALLRRAGFAGASLFGTGIRLLAPDPAAAEARIAAALAAGGVPSPGVAERPLSMEDVFVHRVLALERQERGA